MVIVGDQQSVCIPELERAREGRGRLSGLRFLHILPTDGLLTQEDIMDMIFLRLDAVIALGTAGGAPTWTQSASLLWLTLMIIFFGCICDVTLGTLRIIFVSKGEKKKAPVTKYPNVGLKI